MQNKEYTGIDLFKLICAFLILCIHWEPFLDLNHSLNSATVNLVARLAVPFFFIASGFFAFRKIDFSNPDLSKIWMLIKKLLKLYLVWSVIYLPFNFRDYFEADEKLSAIRGFFSWLRHFVFTAGYGVLWYLPATMLAVFLVALMLKKKMSVNAIIATGLVLFGIGLLGQSYFGAIKPLSAYPLVWDTLKNLRWFFITTRNGIFEGIIFVALGAFAAKNESKYKMSGACIGFAISMVMLFAESFVLAKLNWKLEYDMYLFLVPAAFFLFEIARNINFKNNALALKLRTFSTLFYFTHMLFVELGYAIGLNTKMHSLLSYFIIVVTTLAFDAVIILLSETKAFRFLKFIYN